MATVSSATANIGSEFNNFIKLLTAQVRNQDPLSPMDSTQFVEQLATFSSLEQLVNSNSALTNIATMISDLTGLMASEWLGQEIGFESAYRPFTGEAAEFSYEAPGGTTKSVLSITDADGNVVWSETLDPDQTSFSWNGELTDGGTATKDAMYKFTIDRYQDNTYLGASVPEITTRVTDIISENGTLRLGTKAGLTVDLAQVRKL
ncbi:flagellar biosynthesis protein FlgD [Hyphomonas sp. WL0036]|uniref:flagellar hook assembly protein FlgD n=1 Tax=Hyphomonas sediminis TaxID=2866160 RepID=UPI001C7EBE59|nr:flagellar hook capping FlgD N-terminal domain-containing protein [Hyphomonas sediminis]MBY9065750.1 flagellar biosynthesis protein FlgD [Hyphomonas sediminis]